MNLFLIRHTEYDNPDHIFVYHLPATLSNKGRKQAKKIGKWFVEKKHTGIHIYSSPIVRTVQTAEIIASQTDSDVSIDPNLIEVKSRLQGKPLPDENGWALAYKPGMQESASSILNRTKTAFENKVSLRKDAIMISHGDNLTWLYYFLSKKTPPKNLHHADDYIKKGEIIHVKLKSTEVESLKRIYL